ncbi:hypothetical protein RN001_000412 [Aquatica leii]|uniref:Protein kinase domain-containing protein n=1 Tax=Aquatica leii TaxID=1421715 RepID=A0AAN7PK37_9COLE|nr:hypothetical protein RN001_000412 [Aquatica leii]
MKKPKKTTLSKRFQLLQDIEEMEKTQPSTSKVNEVAVKIMDITQIKEDYILKNLHREAKIMSQLRHPSIVSLFQTMQNGNIYYLVSELVGGGDLCTFIKSQKYGKLDERNTKVYARQLISATAHMHNIGIVHRDLKMENVMVNSIRTQIKIVDFGLSNTYSCNSPLRTHCGSPEYAAPELFIPGKSYGPEVDVWSLGVILFGMVAGQLPFIALHEDNVTSQERRKKLLVQINKGYSNVQRKMLALVSPEFRSLVARMLVADAIKRITITELLLHSWATDKGRKTIVVNPMTQLDDDWKITVMKQVGSILRLEWRTVKYAIIAEPYGDVAGTYNILLHKLYSQRLEGDGITKTNPDHTNTIAITNLTKTISKEVDKIYVKKRIERVKSPSVHKLQKVSTDNTPRSRSSKRPTSTDKRPQTSSGGYRNRKMRDSSTVASGQERPILTADARNRMELDNDIKFNMRTWNYPKPINYNEFPTKITRTNSQHRPQSRSASKSNKKTSTLLKSNNGTPAANTKNEVYVVGSKGISKVLLKKKTQERDVIETSHGESSVLDRTKNKSDTHSINKRFISATTPNKGNRLIAVIGTSSDPKSISPTTDQKIQQIRSRRVVTSKPTPNVERRMHEEGEIQKPRPYSTSLAKSASAQRNILSDPIARSIAGYLAKNMPNKMITRNVRNTPTAETYK